MMSATPFATRVARGAALLTLAAAGLGCRTTGAGFGATTRALSASALVEAMHARYAGKWFRTLTFVQRTTIRGADGRDTVMTWLEATEAPDKLRIDIEPRANGNGMLFRGDSTYRFNGGRLVRSVQRGNPFMPFVVGIYTQPVAQSLREVARERFDTTRVRLDTWQGKPVQIVGASSASDTTSPQFWVELDRLLLVRMLIPAFDRSGKVEDIRLDEYRPAGGGWVAVLVTMRVGDEVVQKEEYTDVKADVALSPQLFDPNAWSTAAHWAPAAAAP